MRVKKNTSLLPCFGKINSAVEVALSSVVRVDQKLINRVVERAKLAPRGRARVLLHLGKKDTLHEMLIALPERSCDVPHINFKSGKSFHVLQGEMSLITFSLKGKTAKCLRIGAKPSSGCIMVRLNKPFWHTIIPHTKTVVFIETILGPFTGNRFAPWCPKKNSQEWKTFANSLRKMAQQNSCVQKDF